MLNNSQIKNYEKLRRTREGWFVPAYDAFCTVQGRRNHWRWNGYASVIKRLRRYTLMDQGTFGKLMGGYSRGQINRYESGRSEPPISFWLVLAKTFGITIDWAMSGKGCPYTLEYLDCAEREKLREWLVIIAKQMEFLTEREVLILAKEAAFLTEIERR